MKQVTDEDSVNTLIAEDKRIRREERELKSKILSIHNPTRKQEEWRKHFGVTSTSDDSYLSGSLF